MNSNKIGECKVSAAQLSQVTLLKYCKFMESQIHKILRWLNNYLSNRVQSVVVNGSESALAKVLSGVLQGSVLGPLLFLIYIDDLPSVLHNIGPEVNLFADDVLLYHVISKEEDFAFVQEAVSLLDNWSVDNHLNFNLTKRKYMIISRKLHPTLPNTPLLLSNHPLQRGFCYKYLGLLLTDNLSWSQHVSSCTDDFTASPIKRHLSNSIFRW